MKEADQFESWANKLVEDSAARMGTKMHGGADRPLPRNIDVQYKASREHPELSREQALALYLSDQLEKTEKIDAQQSKQLLKIDKEVDHVEDDEEAIKAEIARLQQLISGR